MRSWQSVTASISGRRSVVALGMVYVIFAASYPLLPFIEERSVELWAVLGILVGGPGVILLYGGYRLPQTDIRPEFYSTVSTWCLRGVVVGLGIMIPIVLASSDSNNVGNTLLLTALGSLAGFAAGSYDAGAKTRTFDLEQRNQELQEAHADLKEREAELERVRDRMEFALTSTDALVWDWNVENERATHYPSEEHVFGTTVESWEDYADLIHPDDRESAQRVLERSLETGEPKHEEIRIVRDGEVRWIEAPGRPITDADGLTRMVGVARDITERKTFELQLKASNERLEQFAYVASHDLQEPLRMITSYLDLLENRYRDELDDDAREFIDYAVDGAGRMQEMVQDLLTYSQLDTDAEPLEPTGAEAVVETALDVLELQIEENDAEISVSELPTVEADENQLEQVFQNLVSNAIKYRGDDPPRIGIDATRQNEMCRFDVTDNGIGIDPAYADQIFEVFKRLHTNEEYQGTGIGLSLCQKIVEHHGGEIWVESEPGQGSTFSFTIPLVEHAVG